MLEVFQHEAARWRMQCPVMGVGFDGCSAEPIVAFRSLGPWRVEVRSSQLQFRLELCTVDTVEPAPAVLASMPKMPSVHANPP